MSSTSVNKEETPKTEEQKQKEFEALSKLFWSLNIQIKSASYGAGRTDYIRGSDLKQAIEKEGKKFAEKINSVCDIRIDPSDEDYYQFIFEEFHERHMFLKCLKFEEDKNLKYPKRLKPYEESVKPDACCGDDHGHAHDNDEDDHEGHSHGNKNSKNSSPNKKKQPKVEKENFNLFDEKGLYAISVSDPGATTRNSMWLFLAIAGVLAACLFPVWPLELKLGVWWVSYILLMVMVTIIIVRLAVYMLFYVFGITFWIFPNMFDDTVNKL